MTTGTAGGGVTSEAHGIPTTALDTITLISVVLIGADGAVVENGNPYGHANSNYTCNVTSTNIEVDVPAAQTNVASQTLRVYIKGTA